MLVSQRLAAAGKQQRIRLTVDTEEGVTVDEIASVAKKIQNAERLMNLLPEGFELEVTSPGLDYPMTQPYQFRRNLNRRVTVHHDAVGIPNPIEGRISSVNDRSVIVENKTGLFDVPFEKIGKAILVIEVN